MPWQRASGCCGVSLCVVLVLWCGLTVFVWCTKRSREPGLLMQPAHSSASALCTGSWEITAGMTLSMMAREQKPWAPATSGSNQCTAAPRTAASRLMSHRPAASRGTRHAWMSGILVS